MGGFRRRVEGGFASSLYPSYQVGRAYLLEKDERD